VSYYRCFKERRDAALALGAPQQYDDDGNPESYYYYGKKFQTAAGQ
jgi:hypothetical protein